MNNSIAYSVILPHCWPYFHSHRYSNSQSVVFAYFFCFIYISYSFLFLKPLIDVISRIAPFTLECVCLELKIKLSIFNKIMIFRQQQMVTLLWHNIKNAFDRIYKLGLIMRILSNFLFPYSFEILTNSSSRRESQKPPFQSKLHNTRKLL